MNPIILCTAAGILIGMSTGVAASGSAVNGAYVFGPIGLFIGMILAIKSKANEQKSQKYDDKHDVNGVKGSPSVEDGIHEMASGFKKLCRVVWNFEIRLIKLLG